MDLFLSGPFSFCLLFLSHTCHTQPSQHLSLATNTCHIHCKHKFVTLIHHTLATHICHIHSPHTLVTHLSHTFVTHNCHTIGTATTANISNIDSSCFFFVSPSIHVASLYLSLCCSISYEFSVSLRRLLQLPGD